MKTIKLTQVLLLVLFTAFMINAQPKDKGTMMNQLNLTDQQKDKVESIRSEHMKRMIDLRANVQKAEADLHDLQVKGTYSRNDYLAAIDKITKTKNEVAKEMANHRMDVYDQLNNDQKKVFNKMPMGRRGEGMGIGKGNGGPNSKGMHKGKGMGNGNGMGMSRGGDCPCCHM